MMLHDRGRSFETAADSPLRKHLETKSHSTPKVHRSAWQASRDRLLAPADRNRLGDLALALNRQYPESPGKPLRRRRQLRNPSACAAGSPQHVRHVVTSCRKRASNRQSVGVPLAETHSQRRLRTHRRCRSKKCSLFRPVDLTPTAAPIAAAVGPPRTPANRAIQNRRRVPKPIPSVW